MCLPYFLYGLSSPSGGPRCCSDSCAKKACRPAAAYAAFAATATTAAAAASDVLLLLLHNGYLFSVFLKNMLCFAMPTDLSFFRYDICIF